jgi:26 proteasome complex subunit DSS1
MTNKNFFFINFSDWVDSADAGPEEELSVWEDNWDDDNLDVMDDFNDQLKQQMNKK